MQRPARGVGLTFWNGNSLRTVLTPGMRSLVSETQPDILDVHGGPDRLTGAAAFVVGELRKIAPRARFHLGLGFDFWLTQYIIGRISASTCEKHLVDAADLAVAVGAEALVDDAEVACKANSLKTSIVARAVIAQTRVNHPNLIIAHTAYDHPTLHSDDADGIYDDRKLVGEYAWRAFCDENGVDCEIPQNYCAPDDGSFAVPGALRARCESSKRSFDRAKALGWVRANMPIDAYFQGHGVPFAQTATMGCEYDVVKIWCGPRIADSGRMDESGEWAVRVLCAMEHHGIRRPGGILAQMHAKGLHVDQPYPIAGRQVAKSVGVIVPSGVR